MLDLFCGAGGAGLGYAMAGWEVIGVDIVPQPHYPFAFIQADALAFPISGVDAVHASPPCQAYSLAAGGRRRSGHPELIEEVRDRLRRGGTPYVIENVPQAPLESPITLCGTVFALPVIRHRSFECWPPVPVPPDCGFRPTARVKHGTYRAFPYARKQWEPAWREHVLPVLWPWMTLAEAGQAIPPQYTQWIGHRLGKGAGQ